jgi:hypothetical protein
MNLAAKAPQPVSKKPVRVQMGRTSITSECLKLLEGQPEGLTTTEIAEELMRNDFSKFRGFTLERAVESVTNAADHQKTLGTLERANGRYRRKETMDNLDLIVDRARDVGALVIHLNMRSGGDHMRVGFRCRGSIREQDDLPVADGLRLDADLLSQLVDEEPRTRHSRTGRIRVRGADVAAIRIRSTDESIGWVLHIGKPSINDVDLFIQDRLRLNNDLFERCPGDHQNDLHAALNDAFDQAYDLSTFDLDAFAKNRGVTLHDRNPGELTGDRSVMLEVCRRLKATGHSYLSIEMYDMRRLVTRERLESLLPLEEDPVAQEAIRGRLATVVSETAARDAALKRGADVDAGIGQEFFDEDEFLTRIRALGTALLTRSDECIPCIVDVVSMMPLVAVPDIPEFAVGIVKMDWRALFGKIFDEAYKCRDRGIGTEHERAGKLCWEIVRDAYDEVKFNGFPLTDLEFATSSGGETE